MNMPSPASGTGANSAAASGIATAPVAMQVASAPIPFKPTGATDVGGSSFTAASLVCLAFLVLAVLALRRWGPRGARRLGSASRTIEIVETARLADRMRVSVIRYRGRELLVAHSDQTATVLSSGPAAAEDRAAP